MLTGQALENLANVLGNGFNGLEKKIDRNLQIKNHATIKLMNFQRTINLLNSKIHHINNPYLSSDETIKIISAQLIAYISLWNINVKQKMIKISTVKRCLESLLAEEHFTLAPKLKLLIKREGSHYADALNCKNLFNNCENKDLYNKLKHQYHGKI